MNEDEGELDKFLYGDEYSNLAAENAEKDEEIEVEAEMEEAEAEEEEEEDDYEIILDSSKLSSNATNLAASSDLNKRSLTSVAIGDGKGEEVSGSGANGASSAPLTSTTVQVSHFDPFAPANLNGTQIFDHDLENFEDKPWRKPGADLTDYFNFGFNEVTWRAYCVKQKALREEFGLQKKIGVYDSSGMGAGGATGNASSTSLNMKQPREFVNRRAPPPQQQGDVRVYGQYPPPQQQQQQQDHRAYSHNNQQQQQQQHQPHQQDPRSYGQQQQDYRGHAHSHQPRDYNREYSRPRSRHDSPSPPPPPPPSASRQFSSSRDNSKSRSRSPDSSSTQQRRYVSRSSRYDETPRSPPSKRRRD